MSFVLKTTCECFSMIKTTLLFKKTCSETKLFLMARSRSISTTSWELAFPKSHMATFATLNMIQILQITNRGLTWCSHIILGLRGSLIFSISSYPKLVIFFVIPFLKCVLFFILSYFVEYPSFRGEGIQKTLSHGFRFYIWFPSSSFFSLVLPWKRRDSNVERRWYWWSSFHSSLFGIFDDLIFCR